jgi:DNA polymerase I-like protein with 3'-5' exonuclease and polymerase domains
MIVSLDTETTGLDPWHGTKPFLITISTDSDEHIIWDWPVNPLDREPSVDHTDLVEIQELIDKCDRLVLQNSTFDLKMLETLNHPGIWEWEPWPWHKIHDTQLSSHMLASCESRDLTTLALKYLRIDLKPFETEIKKATDKARRLVRSRLFMEEHGEWAIAKDGRLDMPSASGSVWKADMWLPEALAEFAPTFLPDWYDWKPATKNYQGDDYLKHPWLTLVKNYANSDSEATLLVHQRQEEILKSKNLWEIYIERLKLLPIVYEMKETGVTVSKTRKDEIYRTYEKETEKIRQKCIVLADHPELTDLPVNGRSNALNTVVFDHFNLKSPKTTPAGNPSMDKEVMGHWLKELDRKDKRRHFIQGLSDYRKRKTAISYMDGYERFWIPVKDQIDWYVLHPSLHATGTNTLRWASSNPNQQNISKKEGFNLRYCFGPLPGRKWASLDYENIELRIPAYESKELELIALFEEPFKPPYYGSVHLLNFSTVYPDKWQEAIDNSSLEDAADWIKHNWKASWYQRCKNGDFAVQYGSVEKPGGWSTADRAFGRQGCQAKLKERFQKQESLNQHWIDIANKTGYVDTIPDIEINPKRGYPLQCSRAAGGNISPTIPLNYHTQGTACWVIFRAMVKVHEYLQEINRNKPNELKWNMVMQVHDELVIDFPIRKGYQYHLKSIKNLMESCGDPIGVPLKVGCEIHDDNWSQGRSME